MKKVFILLFVFAVALVFMTRPISAEGDKVRGDNADGPSYQLGECPFIG